MPIETVVLGILGAAAWVLGGVLVIKYVLPALKTVVAEVVKNNKATQAFIWLLTYLICLFVVAGVIDKLVGIGNRYVSYVSVVLPAIELLKSIAPYIQWVIIGLAVIIAAERLKIR